MPVQGRRSPRSGGHSRSDAAPGFRHFLAKPLASQRFRAFGIDPLDAPAHLPDVRRPDEPPVAADGRGSDLDRRLAIVRCERWENPSIPSGYTYLLQFVAHDLVQSAIPLSIAGTLGAGTEQCAPHRRSGSKASTAAGRSDRLISMRRMRRTTTDAPSFGSAGCAGRKRHGNACPFRDVARAGSENVTGIDRNIPGTRPALTEALIADPRNDDHAIISQLTAMFAQLHNGLDRPDPPPRTRQPRGGALRRRAQALPVRPRCADGDLPQHPAQGRDAARAASRHLRRLFRVARRSFWTSRSDAGRLADSVRILARRVPFRPRAWCGRNTASTICPTARSQQHAGEELDRTIPSTCRWTRPG